MIAIAVPATFPSALEGLPSFGADLLRMLLLMGGLILLLVLVRVAPRWFVKGNRSATRGLEVVETHTLVPGRHVHLVRVGDQYLVVGSTAGGVELLASGELDSHRLRELLGHPAPPSNRSDEPT